MIADVIVLDRVETGVPAYCARGRATCANGCGHWVWLGDRTLLLVSSGRVVPVCKPCSYLIIPASAVPAATIRDRQHGGFNPRSR